MLHLVWPFPPSFILHRSSCYLPCLVRSLQFSSSPLQRRAGRSPGVNVTNGEGSPEVSVERKSKGQKKREAHMAVDWGIQLASLSSSQLRLAIKWGGLDEQVYEAVMLVKKLGRATKNGRRRQFNFIGALLRGTDPDLMISVIKASKDGDVEGIFSRSVEQTEKSDVVDEG